MSRSLASSALLLACHNAPQLLERRGMRSGWMGQDTIGIADDHRDLGHWDHPALLKNMVFELRQSLRQYRFVHCRSNLLYKRAGAFVPTAVIRPTGLVAKGGDVQHMLLSTPGLDRQGSPLA